MLRWPVALLAGAPRPFLGLAPSHDDLPQVRVSILEEVYEHQDPPFLLSRSQGLHCKGQTSATCVLGSLSKSATPPV